MKFDFDGTMPEQPELNIRAQMGWEYFFGNRSDWACVHTDNGMWILTDESCNLDHALIYPDDEALEEWLDAVAREHLNDAPEQFLAQFVTIKGLMTPEVARAMKKAALAGLDAPGADAETPDNHPLADNAPNAPSEVLPLSAFKRKHLIWLLEANEGVQRLILEIGKLFGRTFDGESVIWQLDKIARVIQDLCRIPHTDDGNNLLYELLDSDLDIGEKADRLLNWER